MEKRWNGREAFLEQLVSYISRDYKLFLHVTKETGEKSQKIADWAKTASVGETKDKTPAE